MGRFKLGDRVRMRENDAPLACGNSIIGVEQVGTVRRIIDGEDGAQHLRVHWDGEERHLTRAYLASDLLADAEHGRA